MISERLEDPPADDLDITVELEGQRTVYRLGGDLDALGAPRLRGVLLAEAAEGREGVIDLSGVHFIDSSGIGVLVGALKRYTAAGNTLVLRGPSSSLRRVLDMTGLSAAFTVEA